MSDPASEIRIRPAEAADIPLILAYIRELADYEKLAHEVTADEAALRDTLFGAVPVAEVLLAEAEGADAGFALYFHNYSTFLGRPGLYLEDLFVRPDFRGRGVGRRLLAELAVTALERGCGRMEWSVLEWNESAHAFYRGLGARPMEGWRVWRVEGARMQLLADSDV